MPPGTCSERPRVIEPKPALVLIINVLRFSPTVRRSAIMVAVALVVVLGGSQSFFALNPTLDISQYGHTAQNLAGKT